ncbi:MAG: hypothetical protein IJ224_10900 [Lachnospiraceae bacterium]|nr:hypothetical protein [Lachnospiraceae bacterium]
MALSLKANDGKKNDDVLKTNENIDADNQPDDFSDLEMPAYKPVVISTEIPDVNDMVSKKDNDIVGIIVKVVVAVIICIVAFTVGKKIIKKISGGDDITDYVNKSENEIEKAFGVDLVDSPEKVSSVHQYSNGSVSVSSDGDISVIYINGVQKGVKVDSKKYSMFGVKIGDPAYKINDNIRYNYSGTFNVLNDMISGKSTTDYYYNRDKNDCFIVIINEDSGRVVSMSYYNDFNLISENLSGLDDD